MMQRFYGPGTGATLMYGMNCNGDEESVAYCSYTYLSIPRTHHYYNQHYYDVSIYCPEGLFSAYFLPLPKPDRIVLYKSLFPACDFTKFLF